MSETEEQKKAEAKTTARPRRWLKRILVLFLLLGAILAGLYVFRIELFGDRLRAELAAALGDALGGRYEIDAIEGDFFSRIEIRGLRTLESGADIRRLEFRVARVDFRLLDLLKDDPIEGIDRISIEGLVVGLDLASSTEPENDEPGQSPTLEVPGLLEQLPKRLPELVVDGRLELQGLSELSEAWDFELEGEGQELALNLRSRDAGANRSGQLDLKILHDPARSLRVEIAGELAGFSLQDGRAELDASGQVEGAARVGLAGGEVLLEASGSELRGDFRSVTITDLPEVLRAILAEELEELPRAGVLDGRASWNFASNEVRGDIGLAGLEWGRLRPATLRLQGRYLEPRIDVASLRLEEERARIELAGLEIDTENWLPSLRVERAKIDIDDLKRLTELIDSPDLDLHVPADTRLETELRGSADEIVLERLAIATEGLAIALEGGVQLPRELENWRLAGVQLDILEFKAADLQDRLPADLVDLRYWRSDIELGGRIEKALGSPLDALEGHIELEARNTEIEPFQIPELTLEVGLKSLVAEIRRLDLQTRDSELKVGGRIDFNDLRAPSFDLEIGLLSRDLSEVSLVDPSLPRLKGRAELEAKVTGDWNDLVDGLGGSGKLVADDLSVDGEPVGRLELTFDRLARAPLNLKTVLETASDERLSCVADVDHEDGAWLVAVKEFVGQARGIEVALEQPSSLVFRPEESLQLDPLKLALLGGRADLRASWNREAGTVFALSAENLELAPLTEELGGRLGRLELKLSGALESPVWSASIEAPALTIGHELLNLSLVARDEGAGLVLERLAVRSAYGRIEGQGVCPIRIGSQGAIWDPRGQSELDFVVQAQDLGWLESLDLPSEIWNRKLDGRLKLGPDTLDFQAELSAPEGEHRIEAPVINEALSLDLVVREKNAELRLDTASDEVVRARFDLSRAWTKPASEVLLDERLSALIDLEKIAGELRLRVPELARFEFVSEDLLRLEGNAEATVRWSDLSSSSDLEGRIALNEVSLRFEGFPGLALNSATFDIRDRELTIGTFDAELGYAPFRLAGGLRWDEGKEIEADLEVTGKNVLVFRDRFARARCDLDCKVTGPMNALHFAGKAVVTDAVYSEPIRFLDAPAQTAGPGGQIFSLRDSLLADATFDIEIRADQSILVSNNVAYGRLSADLHLGGTGSYPEPKGRVDFRQFRVTLPFSKLNVSRGELIFEPSRQLDPKLSVFASTRMRGYDLNLQVRGTSSAPLIEVASNPPLPREDALILLTTGATPGQLKDQGLTQATLTRGGQLIGQSIIEAFSDPNDPERDGYLDRFSLEIGRDVSTSGNSTIESEVRLTDEFFLRFERDRYDEHNLGVVWRLTFK